MYLEKLEINGFKSFAHKEILEFKPGITAVVGPNGSGKSNTADAIRWVLGEQSLKLLRGKKSEDVIFSGSDKKARLGMAEVSLYFNNEKDEAGIEMSEICITRRVYRSGESEYLINKKKSRLGDIQLLLARAGVANTSYSIIGQGMVDSFLLSSAQERKEFFEEASGVKPLQIKRGQALNKLDKTEENLETASIQLNEITPRLNSLTRQVKKLEKRSEIEKELNEVATKYYSGLLSEIEKDWEEKHQDLKKISAQQKEISEKTEKYQNEIAKLTKDSAKSSEFDNLQNEYRKLLDSKMKLNEKIGNLKVKEVQESVKVVKNTNNIPAIVGQEIIKLLNSLNSLNSLNKKFLEENKIDEIKNNFIEQEKLLNKLNELTDPYKDKVENEDVNKPIQDFTKEIAKLEKETEKIDKDIAEIQEKQNKQQEEEKEERSRIWEIQQKYQIEQAELNKISNDVNNLRIDLARLETRRDDLEQEVKQELGNIDVLNLANDKILNEDEKRKLITEIGQHKHQLELIGGIDPEVQTEYKQTKERYEFLSTQLDDLKKSIDALEKLILDLDETIKKQFESNFKIINEEFQKYFRQLFAGGKAQLSLLKNKAEENEDEEEIPEEKTEVQKIKDRLKSNVYAGVEIEATPPGKKLKSINMLSGGERAMTSIALICAIISANPSPFIVLDEVDAALDEANSIRYADIIEELSHKSQFVIITHNRATMEKADVLYGVTMGDDGVSNLLSLKLEGAEQYTNR